MKIDKRALGKSGTLGISRLSVGMVGLVGIVCSAWAAGPGPAGGGAAPAVRSVVWVPLPPKGDAAELVRPSGPPISLTASDGTGLQIVALTARAVVEDPLAFTELHLTFRNPQPRQVEGNFEITLPPGAAISRFAMRQGQSWQEGEVVELQAARAAYEDFLHRRQDPALLEKQAGNQFHARVFPIPASGEKELIVSYSQERPRQDDPFRIYLRGLPQLERLDIRALVGKSELGGNASSLGGTSMAHQSVEVNRSAWTPDVDFEVAVPAPDKGQERLGLRHENLVVARITPITQARPAPVDSAVILLDTSASRAPGFKEQVARLGSLVAKLREQAGPSLPLRVVCFDQEVQEVYIGSAAGFGDRQLQRILERRALGASDLQKALAFLALPVKGPSYHRVLLFTDGIATAGALEGPALQKGVQHLKEVGVQRLDAITFGGIRDETLLGRLVTAGLPSDGVVADGEGPVAAVARKLQNATYSNIKVAVPGSSWVWPVELNGIQPGDQVLVYADLPPSPGQPFEVVLAGAQSERQGVALVTVPRPLLERAWVNARIHRILYQRDTLAASDPDLREGLKHQIIELSTKYRVLSDFTALLVLETEQDYARFKIDRRALADILTVGTTGIELVNRKQPDPVIVAQVPAQVTPPPLKPADPQPQSVNKGRLVIAKEKATNDRDSAAARSQTASAAPAAKQPKASGAKAAESRSRQRVYDFDEDNVEGELVRPDGEFIDTRRASPSAAEGQPALDPRIERPARAPDRLLATGSAPTLRPEPPRSTPTPAPAAEPPSPPPPPPSATQPVSAARNAAVAEPPMAAGSVLSPSTQLAMRRPLPNRLAQGSPAPQLAVAPREPEVIPYQGKLLGVMSLLKEQKREEALQRAWAWRDEDAGDVLALIALGEAFEALGQKKNAARAYGSLIDLFPGRADLRRFAGERLERLGAEGLSLASDTYAQARSQRPDHPASHRLLAYALLKADKPAAAFAVIVEGATRSYPSGRFAGVPQILHEDVGLIAAAWLHREPQNRQAILDRLAALGVALPSEPSVRFVLNWETDANDVDFHIYDGQGGHAFYSQRALPSGGLLYADVTTGYGPECFTIAGRPPAYPYKLQAHYYSRGPMGYGMGKLEIIEHDGRGGLRFIERPFVIMVDRAFVDLGQLLGPIK